MSVHLKFWKIQFWASSTTDFQQTFDRLSLVTHRSTTCCPPFRYIYCGCQPDYLLRQQIFNNTSKLSYYFYIVKMYVRCGNRFYFSRISGVMVRRARLKCCRSWISIPDKDKPNTATKKNQDNVFEWGDMSICRLLFQWPSYTNPTKRVGLVQSGLHHHLIEN